MWLGWRCISGGNFIAINRRSIGQVTYHLGNWEPPWGIEFVVDSATSLTLVIMTGLAFLATLYARALLMSEIKHMVGQMLCGMVAGVRRAVWLVATGDAFNLFVFLKFRHASVILISMGRGWIAGPCLLASTIC